MEVIIDKTFDQDKAENCYMKSDVTLTKLKILIILKYFKNIVI